MICVIRADTYSEYTTKLYLCAYPPIIERHIFPTKGGRAATFSRKGIELINSGHMSVWDQYFTKIDIHAGG